MADVSIFNVLGQNINIKDKVGRGLIQNLTNNVNNLSNVTVKHFNALSKVNDITNNDVIITKGFNSVGDGGDGIYYVSSTLIGEVDGGKIISKNGLYLYLISEINNYVYGIFEGDVNASLFNNLFKNEYVNLYGGVYNVTGEILITNNCVINCKGDVIINGVDNNSQTVMQIGNFNNAQEDYIATNVNADNSTNYFNIPNNSVQAGTLLRLTSPALWLDYPGRYYNQGEFVEIGGRSGNICYLKNKIYETYRGATVGNLAVVDTITVRVTGGKLKIAAKTGSYQYALFLAQIKDGYFDNVDCQITVDGSIAACVVQDCYNVVFENLNCYQNSNPTTGYDYGLSISNSQNIRVINGILSGSRHGCSTGSNRTANNIINMEINVNAVFSSVESYSADFHGNTQYSKYSGAALNGVDMGGNNNSFKGVIYAQSNGACIYLTGLKGYDFDFSGCQLLHNSPANPFITIIDDRLVTFGGALKLNGCWFRRLGEGGSIGLYLR